ncbi:MAG: hypothetical protein QM692_15350 [Thermomicrobiales bacterium]
MSEAVFSPAPTPTAPRLLRWLRANWPILLVFVAFAVAAVIVPTLTNVSTTDDWAYSRSAQILVQEGRLVIFPVVAASSVFPVLWGALFGALFGPTLGVFRLATVVITALGGVLLYALCRDLGVTRGRAALGVAAWLANPLVFILAFTVMTDAHFVTMLLLATWLFGRALCGETLTPSDREALTPNPSPDARERGADRRGRGGNMASSCHIGATGTGQSPSPAHRERGWGEGFSASQTLAVASPWLIAGSLAAGLAFLTRQQGALIVPAVVLWLLLTRRLWFNRASVVLLLQLVTPFALVMAGYYAWLRTSGVPPQVQSAFLREALEEGWAGAWWLLRHLTFVEVMYFGFFTLPIVAAALPYTRSLLRGLSRPGWVIALLWGGVAVAGVVLFWQRGARMPYIPQFFGSGGLGPPDVLGSRPILLGPEPRGVLTIACLLATLLLGVLAGRALGQLRPAPTATLAAIRANRVAGLALCIGLGQVAGVLPPSFHYIGWTAGSLDRYLLPLAPLVIALALWALRSARIVVPLGWVLAAAMLVFSIAGTRDYLSYLRAVWSLADEAVTRGVSLQQLDAGAGWDGYHLYEYGVENRIRSRTPRGGPWWVHFYAPATDSTYVVSGKPRKGYLQVASRPYDSWLEDDATTLYLLRRPWAPWPPSPPSPQKDAPVTPRAADGTQLAPTAAPIPAPLAPSS